MLSHETVTVTVTVTVRRRPGNFQASLAHARYDRATLKLLQLEDRMPTFSARGIIFHNQ